jgi:hypothetical protein
MESEATIKNIDLPETGYKWNELGELAEKFYRDYESVEWHHLIEKLDILVYHILKLVEKKDNIELYQNLWYKKYPLGRMIQLNTSSPYKNARLRIKKYKSL